MTRVELAYWVPESGGYVNADGVRVELPGPGRGAALWPR